MLKFNEGKACDAIVRQIEARSKAQRSKLMLHDSHPQADRRIELSVEVDGALYAIEHTGIEPFADFMRMNGDAKRLYEPIERAVSAALPPNEIVHLTMPAGTLLGRSQKELKTIQESLVRYILSAAPDVPLRSYADYIGDIKPKTPSGVPFGVTLYRFRSPNFPVRFMIKHVLALDVETLRAKRFQQVCDSKFPKLAAWKADGARTILILEDNDIQLTNESLVADAFLASALKREDRPDETYLLNTCTDPTWYLWPILIDRFSFSDLSERYHPIHTEIDSSSLISITGR